MNNTIPPPIVTLICGLGIYLSRSLFPTYNHTSIGIISSLFLSLGIMTLIAAMLSFKKQKTTVNPLQPEKASSLVISGVFKYSRNPMYLGLSLILLSAAVQFNFVGGTLIVLMFIAFITKFQISPEEIAMEKLFGEEFVQYKKKTRKWI
jgi:protein-S-isoprenylcysteine O-methyltransferase Ste14